MILDANTGAILHNDDGDELRHPASLTKMMTLYLTFETVESGRLSMSDKIKISQEAANAAPSNLDLEPGEEIAVSDAIRALITKSANDVAVALSEKIGGSQANFVRLMNARARDLGMSKTHFENASGLPNDDQVTTARDMITLGLRLQDDFPSYYPLFATRAFTYNGSTHRNHNTMLHSFQGIDGIKTGYTRGSGFNLVSSVHRGGRHVLGAVFGGDSAASRNGEMRNLLTRALTRAATVKTRTPAPALIARLKSAPKLAARPALKDPAPKEPAVKVAAAAPAPKPAVTKTAAAAPEPQPAPAVEAIVPAPQPVADAAATPLEVFKVKRVMVAPRQGPKRPAPSADETTDMAPDESNSDKSIAPAQTVSVTPPSTDLPIVAASSETPADAIAQTFAAADTEPSETVIPKLVVAAASAETHHDTQMAMLGGTDAVLSTASATTPVALAPAGARPAAIPTRRAPVAVAKPKPAPSVQTATTVQRGPNQRGLAPSSLQAQAASLGAAPQRVATLQPSAAGPLAVSTGHYEIQIGAYGTIDEAQRALSSVQTRASKLLAGAPSVTHPVQKDGRQVFRARFSGFDAQRAASTCTELRRQAVDCFVMTAE